MQKNIEMGHGNKKGIEIHVNPLSVMLSGCNEKTELPKHWINLNNNLRYLH